MKTSLLPLSLALGIAVATPVHGTLLAYYVDGVDIDSAALIDQAANGDVTASNLSNVGFEGGTSITRTEFGTGPSTPAGPTAGSGVGSEWLFARANATQPNPGTTTDYFGFTVSANTGTLNLTDLVFDRTNRANTSGGINTTYEVFVSVDSAPFASFGSDTITAPAVLGTFLDPATTQTTDLSSITGASSVEIRIALGDNSGVASKSSWVQGIQLNGTVVPEPGMLGLSLVGLGVLFGLRRCKK